MGDLVGLVMLSMSFHVVEHEAFVSVQLSPYPLASPEPISEPAESLGRFVRTLGLLPHLVSVFRDKVLIMVRPGLVEIPMDLEALSVADVEFSTPTRQ